MSTPGCGVSAQRGRGYPNLASFEGPMEPLPITSPMPRQPQALGTEIRYLHSPHYPPGWPGLSPGPSSLPPTMLTSTGSGAKSGASWDLARDPLLSTARGVEGQALGLSWLSQRLPHPPLEGFLRRWAGGAVGRWRPGRSPEAEAGRPCMLTWVGGGVCMCMSVCRS